MNLRKVVEAYTPNVENKFLNKNKIQDLDKTLEKLLLTGENKNNTNKEK
jgi:hypothetical protein